MDKVKQAFILGYVSKLASKGISISDAENMQKCGVWPSVDIGQLAKHISILGLLTPIVGGLSTGYLHGQIVKPTKGEGERALQDLELTMVKERSNRVKKDIDRLNRNVYSETKPKSNKPSFMLG